MPLVRRSEGVPDRDGSRPILAIHSAGRRAYWRMLRQRRCRGAMERKSPGRLRLTAISASLAGRICSVICNLTGRPVWF